MKKILKWAGIALLALIAFLLIAGLIAHQPRPQGESGPRADALARTMLAAVDQPAWDSTRYVQWTFMGMHHYIWDREEEWVDVRWDTYRVLLHTPTQEGYVWKDGRELTADAAAKKREQAWAFFCNDSFWLQAFNKVFDPGTSRRVVEREDGSEALLVTYETGGVTPGDSYLWLLDDSGRPQAWQMWVSVVPIGGLTFTWENWQELSTGALVALDHKNRLANVAITRVHGGTTLSDLEVNGNPFAEAN